MAVRTGIEPAISSVTGRHVKPLHHRTNGADEGNRTLVSTLARSRSTIELHLHMAVRTGIEPAISSVTGRHVNRYTTGPSNWRRRRDLNPRAGFPTYALSRGTSSAS